MMQMRVLAWILTAAVILLTAFPGQARHRSEQVSKPGSFDYYLLSLSVAPSFCRLTPTHQTSRECRSLTPEAFEQTPLTIHGLWPNRAEVSVNQQPHDCAGPPFHISDALQEQLARYMPGGIDLAQYEWRKHGTCSGLSPDAYFAKLVSLAQMANDLVGDAMRNHGVIRTSVSVPDLLSAVALRDQSLASAIVVSCRIPRGGGNALVEEIRVVLTKDFTPKPAREVGLGQNSGCPKGIGHIPDPAAHL